MIIFNIIPIIAAIIAAIIGCTLFSFKYDNVFPAIIVMFFYSAGLGYILILPSKFILYPILYEKLESNDIIRKFMDKYRTDVRKTILTILGLGFVDFVLNSFLLMITSSLLEEISIYLWVIAILSGLTMCMLTLLLWFKIRKPENNGKRLFLYYVILTVIFLIVAYILKNHIT